MTKVLWMLGLGLILSMPAMGQAVWVGEGYGDREEKARLNALEDLASQFEVKVRSETAGSQILTKANGKDTYSSALVSNTFSTVDLPLLGVKLDSLIAGNSKEFHVRAKMVAEISLPLYEGRLNEVNQQMAKLQAAKPRDELVLGQLLALCDQFGKYAAVTTALGGKVPEPLAQRAAVAAELASLQNTIDSLEKAARALVKTIRVKDVFVYPPSAQGSTEITPLGAALREALKKELATVDSPDKARYLLKGTYYAVGKNLEVSISVVGLRGDDNGRVAASSLVRLLPAAFAGLDWQPKGADFDKLLQDGLVVSGDFRIEAATNRGRTDLLFKDGEEVELLAKLNAPGWFYVVSHITVDGQQFSYLLDFDPAQSGNRRFIRYLGPDEAGRWVSIGKFEVTPPYGVERLQFVAAGTDLVDSLPAFRFDPDSGYFKLLGAQEANLSATRGLKVKAAAKAKAAEGTLTLTTLK